MACSAFFFSRNSVFLSQQFSRDSVFQPNERGLVELSQMQKLDQNFRKLELTCKGVSEIIEVTEATYPIVPLNPLVLYELIKTYKSKVIQMLVPQMIRKRLLQS